MELIWENIKECRIENSYFLIKRARVYGGWVLINFSLTFSPTNNFLIMAQSESMTFIPDSNHEWGKKLMDGVI